MKMSTNEPLQVGIILQNNQLAPATPKSTPLKSGELKLLEAVTNNKIINESVENINTLFRFCFLIVGLRERSFPNELESLFLHEYLKENYGGHTVAEIRLAFKMAVNNELDIEHEKVVCYENFSVLYLSSIINAYRRWSSETFRQVEKFIPPSPEDDKYLEGPRQGVHWGYFIEKEYQHFLSFGDEHWKIYPVSFYDQLVLDGVFEEQLFRKAMKLVRKKSISLLQKEKAVLEMRKFTDKKNEREELAEGIHTTNIKLIQDQIDGYKSGNTDSKLEIIAKQYCVLQFFKNSKDNLNRHVYLPLENK